MAVAQTNPSGSSSHLVRAVLQAEKLIRPHIRETPLEPSAYLSDAANCEVYLKLEHLQHTGSFKLRGAMNKVFSLSPEQLKAGIVAASTGNHGMAVSYAAQKRGLTPTIYMKGGASPDKVALIKSFGGKAEFYGDNPVDAENHAREISRQTGQVFISPYNDPQVIAGQGTLGVEIYRQLDSVDVVFVAVGGGGLISGMASYLKSVKPGVKVVGCWPENSRVMYECIKAGRVIDFPEQPTISDSTAGGVEDGAITVDLCRELIDDFVLVSEREIVDAMHLILRHERWMVEGAAGVAVAALLKRKSAYSGKKVVPLLCGRNIPFEKMKAVFEPAIHHQSQEGARG
ncbi:MAG TPA: threonine/serine dehydratase [Terriglobales bacterium]|nr:threonine/serine dehydratase [Terriglobales bacterium]